MNIMCNLGPFYSILEARLLLGFGFTALGVSCSTKAVSNRADELSDVGLLDDLKL